MNATHGFEESCQEITADLRDLRASLGFLASFQPADLEAKVRALVEAAVERQRRCRFSKGSGRILVSPCLDPAENVYGPCPSSLCAALAPFKETSHD